MTNVQQLLQKHRAVRDLFPSRKFINLKTFKAEREDLFREGSSKQSIMYRLGCNAMCPTLAIQYLCQETNKSRDRARDSAKESEREGMMYPCGRQQCVERDGASVNWRRRNALFNTVYLQSTLSVVVMVVTSF